MEIVATAAAVVAALASLLQVILQVTGNRKGKGKHRR